MLDRSGAVDVSTLSAAGQAGTEAAATLGGKVEAMADESGLAFWPVLTPHRPRLDRAVSKPGIGIRRYPALSNATLPVPGRTRTSSE
ncbi:MAG: hypothetical protein H7288_02395 [Kineosporiaceae bacterium]|nr:hypothetical protein [Aeromicrobium sp.]